MMIIICPICVKAGETVPLQSAIETRRGFCPKCDFVLPNMVTEEADNE